MWTTGIRWQTMVTDVILCGQNEVMPDTCQSCGGWLHVERRGGFDGCCSEDCLADLQELVQENAIEVHLRLRDMLCHCAEVCAPRGLPTQDEKDEKAAYERERWERSNGR